MQQCTELISSWRAFSVQGVLTPDDCAELIERATSLGFADAPITTARGFQHRPDIRNNTRVIIDDTELAIRLWPRLRPWFPAEPGVEPLGLNERFRVYRYDPGEFFAPHRDGHYQRPNTAERSIYTVLLYLNDDFEGGATAFLRPRARYLPKKGSALCFVHPLVHEGQAVVSGRKLVLRTDVMYRVDGLGRR